MGKIGIQFLQLRARQAHETLCPSFLSLLSIRCQNRSKCKESTITGGFEDKNSQRIFLPLPKHSEIQEEELRRGIYRIPKKNLVKFERAFDATTFRCSSSLIERKEWLTGYA
jgi:hypothetical protein